MLCNVLVESYIYLQCPISSILKFVIQRLLLALQCIVVTDNNNNHSKNNNSTNLYSRIINRYTNYHKPNPTIYQKIKKS